MSKKEKEDLTPLQDAYLKRVGLVVKEYRRKVLKLSREKFKVETGVTTVSTLEGGAPFNILPILRICEKYKLEPSYFLSQSFDKTDSTSLLEEVRLLENILKEKREKLEEMEKKHPPR